MPNQNIWAYRFDIVTILTKEQTETDETFFEVINYDDQRGIITDSSELAQTLEPGDRAVCTWKRRKNDSKSTETIHRFVKRISYHQRAKESFPHLHKGE